jgi:hypothetical protein
MAAKHSTRPATSSLFGTQSGYGAGSSRLISAVAPPGLAWAFIFQKAGRHTQQLDLAGQLLDLGFLFAQNVLDIFHRNLKLHYKQVRATLGDD